MAFQPTGPTTTLSTVPITRQDLYDLIDDIIKVNPAATDASKLQGQRHRSLLKTMVDYIAQNATGGSGTETGSFPFDWTAPSNAFNGYSNSETTFKAGMIKFLHRASPPSASISASGARREFGSPTDTSLTYAVARGTSAITTLTVNGVTTINPSTAQLAGTVSASANQNVDTTFSMSAVDSAGGSAVTNTTVHWRSKLFMFSTPTDLINANDVTISGYLQNVTDGTLVDSRNISRSVTASNAKIYVAYAANLDAADSALVVNTFQDTSFRKVQFNYTNQYGYTQPFVLFVGANDVFGTFNIDVK